MSEVSGKGGRLSEFPGKGGKSPEVSVNEGKSPGIPVKGDKSPEFLVNGDIPPEGSVRGGKPPEVSVRVGRPPEVSVRVGKPLNGSVRGGNPPGVSERGGNPPEVSERGGNPPEVSVKVGKPPDVSVRVGNPLEVSISVGNPPRGGKSPKLSLRDGNERGGRTGESGLSDFMRSNAGSGGWLGTGNDGRSGNFTVLVPEVEIGGCLLDGIPMLVSLALELETSRPKFGSFGDGGLGVGLKKLSTGGSRGAAPFIGSVLIRSRSAVKSV